MGHLLANTVIRTYSDVWCYMKNILCGNSTSPFVFLKENHCCFSCLKKANGTYRASTCHRRRPCGELRNGVPSKNFHHRLLHSLDVQSSVVGVTPYCQGGMLLPVATLRVSSKGQAKDCNIMLTGPSWRLYVRQSPRIWSCLEWGQVCLLWRLKVRRKNLRQKFMI